MFIFFSAQSDWCLLAKISPPKSGKQQKLPKGFFHTHDLAMSERRKKFWSLRCKTYLSQVRSHAEERCRFRGRYFFTTGELFVSGEHNHPLQDTLNSEELCTQGIFVNILYVISKQIMMESAKSFFLIYFRYGVDISDFIFFFKFLYGAHIL